MSLLSHVVLEKLDTQERCNSLSSSSCCSPYPDQFPRRRGQNGGAETFSCGEVEK